MRLNLRTLSAAAVLFAAMIVTAHADTFSYAFSEASFLGTDAFTYTSPTQILTTTTFTPDTCSVFGGACSYVSFTFGGVPYPAVLEIGSAVAGYEGFQFFPVSFFTTIGTNTQDVSANGPYYTMTVTDIPGTTVTPEPSTFIFLGTGILGLAGVARRKFLRI